MAGSASGAGTDCRARDSRLRSRYGRALHGEYEVLSFDVHETLLGNPGEMSAEAKDAKTIVLTGLPKDIQNPVAKVTHPDPNGQGHHASAIVDAENVSVVDGVITLGEPLSEGATYTVTVTSDNYGDVSASVQLKAAE